MMSVSRWSALMLIPGLLLANSAQALDIIFDYRFDRSGWFSEDHAAGLMRREVLQQAASVFSGFSDHLLAIDPGAGNSWSVSFQHPSWSNWLEQATVSNLLVPEKSLVVFVGASSFSGGVLGAAGGGNVQAQGSQAFLDSVEGRGQAGALADIATDVAPWGGSIWFNSYQPWYIGLNEDGLSAGQPDLLTTATHEIAHLLGFGASAAWDALVQGGVFTGEYASAVYGGAVPVDGVGAHWAYGVEANGLMDPGTVPGKREYLSELDYAALRDIGWQVSAVPEPSTISMLLLGLVGVFARWRRKQAKRF